MIIISRIRGVTAMIGPGRHRRESTAIEHHRHGLTSGFMVAWCSRLRGSGRLLRRQQIVVDAVSTSTTPPIAYSICATSCECQR